MIAGLVQVRHPFTQVATILTPMMANTHLIALARTATDGVAIAVAGMLIVGFALAFVSLFIAAMPHVLKVVGKVWPEVDEPHHKRSHAENHVSEEEAILAAIGFVLHYEFQKQIAGDQAVVKKDH